jgi:hypothetical protein
MPAAIINKEAILTGVKTIAARVVTTVMTRNSTAPTIVCDDSVLNWAKINYKLNSKFNCNIAAEHARVCTVHTTNNTDIY